MAPPETAATAPGRGRSTLARTGTLVSCVAAAALALATIDYAQQAWLLLPVALAVVALFSLPVRLRRRHVAVPRWKRAVLAAPALALLPHLPLAAPDLPGQLGVSRLALVLVPGCAAVLLAVRAWTVPGTRLLAARLTGASVLTLLLCLNLLTYYDVLPAADRAVEVQMPLEGEWMALQAGRSLLTNHHTLHRDQNYAIDFTRRLPGGTTFSGDRNKLQSYEAFGMPLLSPVDGRVVRVVSDLPDQEIGSSDSSRAAGNHVVVRVNAMSYVLLAHLRQGSVVVREGQAVAAGTPLGEVGNSGNTTEPHLHMHAMTQLDDGDPLRLRFNNVAFTRHGNTRTANGVELRRNDRVRAE